VKLIRRVSLGLREGNSDKVYIVDLCEVAGRKFVVNFQFGRRGQPLKDGTKTDTPVAEAVARSVFAKLVDEKTRKGYSESNEAAAAAPVAAGGTRQPTAAPGAKPTRVDAIMARLRDPGTTPQAWDFARAAWRAGELRLKAAVPRLIASIGSGDVKREYCVLWALARCGDESSFAALVQARKQTTMPAERAVANLEALIPRTGKSPMLMRVALEMLRAWGDELRAVVVQRAHGELPPGLRYAVEQGPAEAFAEVLQRSLAAGESAAVLEVLYRIDSPVVRPGLLAALRSVPLLPGSFRAVRHIFKIAELRGDAEVYGLLALRFERTPHNFSARYNSVYVDGRRTDVRKEQAKPDSRLAYGNRTRAYLRRRSWATLRRLATLDDAAGYVRMAVGVLLPFTDADGGEPRTVSRYEYSARKTVSTHWDRFSSFLAFNHILYENSHRYELKRSTQAWRCRGGHRPGNAAPAAREEAYPALWDRVPVGLLHLVAESECQPVHEFAVKALRVNKTFCDELDLDTIVMLLGRPYEVTAQLGYELALARYDASNPDFELVAALASCPVALARQTARTWIDADRMRFAGARDLMVSLVLSPFADTRAYGRALLMSVVLPAGVAESLIARAIAVMLALPADAAGSDAQEARAKEGADTLLRVFARPLRSLGLGVLRDLVHHPLAAVQGFAAEVLLAHEVRPEDLPEDLIAALAVESPFPGVRSLGVRLFGELPDEVLLQRVNLLLAFATSALPDQRGAIRPVLQRLALLPSFGELIVPPLLVTLLTKEEHEGVHSAVLALLKTDLAAALGGVPKEAVLRLLRSKHPAAQELGGILLARNVDPSTLAVAEVARLASHEILSVREAAWKFFSENKPRLVAEMDVAIKILDAAWEDSRRFAFALFRGFEEHDFTPDVLVAVCDSVRPEVQAFGRELVTRFFRESQGHEYLLRLSEHPSADVQLFATNYLETYATGSLERLRQLEPYFLGVLSRVNRGRVAKARVFAFLTAEAERSPEAAQLVATLMTRQSLTMAIGDKAASIVAMVAVAGRFADTPLPIVVKPRPLWTRKQVLGGV
jgi:predicted DNA-binding WGR domain protein